MPESDEGKITLEIVVSEEMYQRLKHHANAAAGFHALIEEALETYLSEVSSQYAPKKKRVRS